MQAVLCAILCGSVGLADFVKNVHLLNGTRLAGVRYVNRVGVKLPSGWIFERQNQGSILFVAVEPDSADRKGRRLTIRTEKVDPSVSPEEYLQSSGLLRGTVRIISADPSENVAQAITVAGQPGVLLPVKKPVGGFPFLIAPVMQTQLLAASVRPSGLAVSLQLECPDDTDPQGDEQMISDIAAAMDIQDSASGQ